MNLFYIGKKKAPETIPLQETNLIGIASIAKSCGTVKEFLQKISLPVVELNKIEKETRGQSDNATWYEARKGRVTASNFYRVHTKIQSMKKNPKTDIRALLKSLIDPPVLGHLDQISHGSKNEKTAVSHLVVLLTAQGHHNVSVTPCGLFVHPDKQYLGASPDGIVSCSCCSTRLLEVKCPTKPVAELAYLESDGCLKKKSSYYGQVQGQMLITNMQECYFFVYESETSNKLQLITYDKQFSESLEASLELFYQQFMAPQLLGKKL